MADDDNEIEAETDEEATGADDLDVDPDAVIDDDLVADVDDDDDAADAADDDSDDDDSDDDDSAARARKRKGADDDDDDDDDMLAPDDVEDDLDTILKDRMVTKDEDEDEDEDTPAPAPERGEAVDGIQPKRADETLCTSCFLLVRSNAPGCPVEDDDCPIFG